MSWLVIIECDEIVANIDIYINISSILYINILINWLLTLIVNFMSEFYPIIR